MSDQTPYEPAPPGPPHPYGTPPRVPTQGSVPPGYPPGPVPPGSAPPGYPPSPVPQGPVPPGYPPSPVPPGYPPATYDGIPTTYGGTPATYGGTPAPAPRKSRKGLWIGLSIALVLLIAGGVAVVALLLPEVKEATTSKLSTPQTVAGLTLAQQPQLQNAASQMNAQLRKDVENSTGSIGAFYNDPSDPSKILMIAGVTGVIANPEKELDDTFTGISQAGMTASNIHTVDAGPLGGQAKCGEGETSGQPFIVCAWSDRGSLGMMIFFNRDAASSERLFRQIRGEILTRG
jgi:hypothetical protein